MVTICNDTESGFHYWSGISAWPHKFTAKSFVPRPPPFIPSVCVHNNTREWKTSKKLGRFESVHHVSRRKVDIRGRGWYSQICNVLNLKVSILRVKMSNFDHAKVWSPKLQYRTCEILSSVLFWQLGPSPLAHLASTRRHWMLPGFPVFHWPSSAVYYCEHKRKVKIGKGVERGFNITQPMYIILKGKWSNYCSLG